MRHALQSFFPSDYSAARERFTTLARECGAELRAYLLAARGPRGETLTVDTACLGARAPRVLLVLSSGTHGVEGFAGSALQQLFLAEHADAPWPADSGILLVHALNPYGFAHLRRVNENNVDLNRNALDCFPGPPNPVYRRLDAWLNPRSPPRHSVDTFLLRGLWHRLALGRRALAQAVAGGQYEFPRGLFYGGGERQESLRIFTSILQEACFARVKWALHLDLHTGLGRFGAHWLVVDAPEGSPAYARWQRWFGAEAVASGLHGGGPAAYAASGTITTLTARSLPGADVAAAVLEFGTYSAIRVLRVLCRENRLHHFGDLHSRRAARIKADMLETFFPSDPAWRSTLLAGGRRLFACLPGLMAEHTRDAERSR